MPDSHAQLRQDIKKLNERLTKLEGDRTDHIGIVLDASSSMGSRYRETLDGFNEFVATLRKSVEVPTRVTLQQFASVTHFIYRDASLDEVPKLTQHEYVLNGLTALYDGIEETIAEVARKAKGNDRVTIVIMTDGGENASRRGTLGSVRSLIAEYEATGQWTFVFLGAGIDAFTASGGLGISRGNTMSYAGDAHSHSAAFTGTASAMSYRSLSPLRSTEDFYAEANVKNDLTANPDDDEESFTLPDES